MELNSIKSSRRDVVQAGLLFLLPTGVVSLLAGCAPQATENSSHTMGQDQNENETNDVKPLEELRSMQVQYLEIVTPEVEAVCKQYALVYQLSFGEPDVNLGGARTAELSGGGMLGVRAPLRDTETPVVRPYMLVQDIEAAVKRATEAGAELALPPMELPGHGTCAIVIQGGIEFGFWQV